MNNILLEDIKNSLDKDCIVVIDNENNEYEILFDTAWNLPDKIMLEFSKFCKNGELHWEYKNEDEERGTDEFSEISCRKQ